MEYKEIQDLHTTNTKDTTNDVIETTFKSMGIRAEKKIAEHIIIQNTYNNNLVPDISTVNYTKNNKGKTNLKEITGNGVFVDDLFVYGYLGEKDVVFNKNGFISCTTGKNGSSTFIIEQIRSIVNFTIGKNNCNPIHINFMGTYKLKSKENIKEQEITLNTINNIEHYVDVKSNWKNANNGEDPFGVFIIKIDVSNIELKDLQDNLKLLQAKLLYIGSSIFSVDYTKDFSGTLNKKELIKYLLTLGNFKLQQDYYKDKDKNIYWEKLNEECCFNGDEKEDNLDAEYTILKNSSSAGNNTLTFITNSNYEKTNKCKYRTKLYNKPVCNWEKSDVRTKIGGHICNYANSCSNRLKKLFSDKEAQERGITRIEISVYGFHKDISKDIGEKLIEDVFNIFYVKEDKNKLELKEDLKEGIEEDLKEGIEEDLKEGIEEDLKKGIEEDLKEGIEEDLKEGIEEDLKEGIEEDLKEGIEEDLKKGIEEDLKEGIEEDFYKIIEGIEGDIGIKEEDIKLDNKEIFNMGLEEEEEKEIIYKEPLFYISPIKQQWENLMEKVDKNFVLVDKINKIIYIIFYGSTLTNTAVGNIIDYSKNKLEEDSLENFIRWAISDFCFRMVPIYRTDILGLENGNKIIFSNIFCYGKNKDSYTILATCKRPLQIFKDPPIIDFFFPKNEKVEWCWRVSKEKQPNYRTEKQELIDFPELAKHKKLYTNSAIDRNKQLEELLELKNKTNFLHSRDFIFKNLRKENYIPGIDELEIIKMELKEIENFNNLKKKSLELTKNSLNKNPTFTLADIIPKNYKIVGWKEYLNKEEIVKVVVVLEELDNTDNNTDNILDNNTDNNLENKLDKYFNIWANKQIKDYILKIKNFFSTDNSYFMHKITEIKEKKKEHYFTFIPEIKDKFFNITIFPSKKFYLEKDNKYITYFPIKFKQDYGFSKLKEELEILEKEQEETIKKYNNVLLKNTPLPEGKEKYWCRDIKEGIYKVERITDTFYGKKTLIYLHLKNIEDNKELIVKGHFIEEEWRKLVKKLNGQYPKHPIICRLGIIKTEEKSKRKFRVCNLEYEEK